MQAKPKSSPTFSLSTAFRVDDADVIIRAEGAVDFRVHKCILSFVSPVFKDMFTFPQPPTDTPGVLPHVDVQDPPEVWENLLRTIYPTPNPVIDNLDDLESLLLTAKKYEMDFVIDSYKQHFENQEFIQREPLHLYAIARAGGLTEQARYVASRAGLFAVLGRWISIDDLKCLILSSYHRLVSFLVETGKKLNPITVEAPIPNEFGYKRPPWVVYDRIRSDVGAPYLQRCEVYLNALERLHRDRTLLGEEQGAQWIYVMITKSRNSFTNVAFLRFISSDGARNISVTRRVARTRRFFDCPQILTDKTYVTETL